MTETYEEAGILYEDIIPYNGSGATVTTSGIGYRPDYWKYYRDMEDEELIIIE